MEMENVSTDHSDTAFEAKLSFKGTDPLTNQIKYVNGPAKEENSWKVCSSFSSDE